MIKNISYFNVCEARRGLFGNIKIANVLYHPVQAKNMNFNPYIYILYYQSNLLNYLQPNPASNPYKMEYCICNGGVGTARERNSCT